jgi:hypothetical protein
MNDEEPNPAPYLRKRRAERRAQRKHAVARALRVARLFGIPPCHAEAWAKHNADNLKMCSCWMCGHVRKWFGPPVREIRRSLADDEQR